MKNILFVLGSFLCFNSLVQGQNICGKDIVIWNFKTANNNDDLAFKIASEVEWAIIGINKARVLERNNYHEIIGVLQNEQNLCNCPEDLVENTVQQLKEQTADLVIFGNLERDEYDNRISLKLIFTNLKKLTNDKKTLVLFTPNEFNDTHKRRMVIKEKLSQVFVCDKIAEEIEKVSEEIELDKRELAEINETIEKEYEKRNELDERLIRDKKIKKSFPELIAYNKSITQSLSDKKEIEKRLEIKKSEKEKLLRNQINKEREVAFFTERGVKAKSTNNNLTTTNLTTNNTSSRKIKEVRKAPVINPKKGEVIVVCESGAIVRLDATKKSEAIASFTHGTILRLGDATPKDRMTIDLGGGNIVTEYWYEVVISQYETGWVFGGCINKR